VRPRPNGPRLWPRGQACRACLEGRTHTTGEPRATVGVRALSGEVFMRRLTASACAVAALALFVPASAVAGTLTLHPAGFGPHSWAATHRSTRRVRGQAVTAGAVTRR